MKWDAIAQAIQNAVGPDPGVITGKRCKERMKTLTGYYQNVETKKKKVGVTEEEWRKSNGLAVDWWHTAIGEFCGPRRGKLKDRKPATKKFATRFNSLYKSQRSTLLGLHFLANCFADDDDWLLSKICECLSIMQNRSCSSIYRDAIALERMGLVRREYYDDEGITSELFLDISGLHMHEIFFKKAAEWNPAYDTRRTITDDAMVTFDATRAPSGITMLLLHDCEELAVVDLSGFWDLRFLYIWRCPKLREMIGCECPEELGWLDICGCHLYLGYPQLRIMPSLQAFRFQCRRDGPSERVLPGGELDVSGCVRLRTLVIEEDSALSSIRGLEGLHSLTALEFRDCKALQNLPDIGHMKDLTHLTIHGMPVEEIKGVEKLLGLEELHCSYSKLKTLCYLGHLPHLKLVGLYGCPVVEDPSSPYFRQPWRRFNCESHHIVDVSDTE